MKIREKSSIHVATICTLRSSYGTIKLEYILVYNSTGEKYIYKISGLFINDINTKCLLNLQYHVRETVERKVETDGMNGNGKLFKNVYIHYCEII